MSYLSIGDLAQSLQLRQDNARLRSDLLRLSSELASGRKSDVTTAVSGDFGALGAIERSLARLASFDFTARETAHRIGATQDALGALASGMPDLSESLLLSQGVGQPQLVDAAAADARTRMAGAVAALNARSGDRNLFSGLASDGPAVAPAETILAELATAATGQTTAAGVDAVIDGWFAPGGGFDTTGYLGGSAAATAVGIAEGETLALDVTAGSAELRATLAALAKAAILDVGALAGSPSERAQLALRAGESLVSAEAGVVDLQARVGAAERQAEQAIARNRSERTALEIARNDLTAADPFRTASELKAAETQLETLYALTARLSRLTLTEFLR